MTTQDKVLKILALDFAILVAIIGGWFIFVMAGPNARFSDLYSEPNLIKLSVAIVAWLVLYAQHIRTAGDFNPPAPAAALTVEEQVKLRAFIATLPAQDVHHAGPPAPPPAPTPPVLAAT